MYGYTDIPYGNTDYCGIKIAQRRILGKDVCKGSGGEEGVMMKNRLRNTGFRHFPQKSSVEMLAGRTQNQTTNQQLLNNNICIILY